MQGGEALKIESTESRISTNPHLHFRRQTAPLTAKRQELSPWSSALSNRASLKAIVPCLSQFAKNPHSKSELLRVPYYIPLI